MNPYGYYPEYLPAQPEPYVPYEYNPYIEQPEEYDVERQTLERRVNQLERQVNRLNQEVQRLNQVNQRQDRRLKQTKSKTACR